MRLRAILLIASYIILQGVVHAKEKRVKRDVQKGVELIYAVNAGGEEHRDSYGVLYQKDPSTQGVSSDYGRRLNIDRVHPNDEALYQTERYSQSTFGYDIPIVKDGSYVLVLKFAEVYFRSPREKVFDVVLNAKHKIIHNLDIFGNVGYATAHDEIIPFTVIDNGKTLLILGDSSEIRRGRIRLDFVKGLADNPKVNAFMVIKGSYEDVPQLPPLQMEDGYGDEDNEEMLSGDEDIQFNNHDLGYESSKQRPYNGGYSRNINVQSGPVSMDPWEDEEPWVIYMPLVGSIAVSVLSVIFVRSVI